MLMNTKMVQFLKTIIGKVPTRRSCNTLKTVKLTDFQIFSFSASLCINLKYVCFQRLNIIIGQHHMLMQFQVHDQSLTVSE